MTSVQNLPLLLNGNSMIGIIVCLLVFFGCGTVQPLPTDTGNTDTSEVTTVKVYNPETGEYEEVSLVQEPMDTIQFDETNADFDPPITDETPVEVIEDLDVFTEEKKESYDVSLLLPFVSNSTPSAGMQVNRKSLIAIQFYAGAKLALEQLTSEGINVNLSAYDTKANEGQVINILTRSEVIDSDLIIGPYRNASVRAAADFAKEYEKPVVSPFTAHESITRDNPYFIQMNPGLKSHMKSILSHITSQYSTDQITLVALDNSSERQRLQKFQEVHQEMIGSKVDSLKLDEFIISRTIAMQEEFEIDTTLFAEGRKAIYVFPSWSSERQIYEFLRKINVAKGSEDRLMVYGMPQWSSLEYYDYFERLNVHIPKAIYLDNSDRRVGDFKVRYINEFGDMPDENAYLGYDTMLYFGRQLAAKGVHFHKILDQLDDNMMTGYFDFERQVHSGNIDDMDMKKFDQYEKSNLNIIQFKNYRFQKAN